MSGINKVILIGYIEEEPQQASDEGESILRFSLRTETPFTKDGNKNDQVEMHNIIILDKLTISAMRLLTKGKLLYIEGKAITTCVKFAKDIKRYHTEVLTSYFKLLGRPKDFM